MRKVSGVSSSQEAAGIRLPPLSADSGALQHGIHGNAMALPPTKDPTEVRKSSGGELKVRGAFKNKSFKAKRLIMVLYMISDIYCGLTGLICGYVSMFIMNMLVYRDHVFFC